MDQDKKNTKKKSAQKYDLNEVEDIWQTLLDEDPDADAELFEGENQLYGYGKPDESAGDWQDQDSDGEQLENGDQLYADTYADLALEDDREIDTGEDQPDALDSSGEDLAGGSDEDEPLAEETAEAAPPQIEFAAVVTFIGGMRREVARARLLLPRDNTIWLVDRETGDEMLVPLEQLACIRLSGLPAGISARQMESSRREIIETVDGKTRQVLVSPGQDLEGLLCCFSTEEQTGFPVTRFPRSSITRRTQDRQLRDILLEKRLISRTILQKALQEFEWLKTIPFAKIVAKRARVPLTEIEQALDNARQNQMLGMQTGEILLISGLVNEEQILDAIDYHEHLQNLQFSQFLVERRFVREPEVYAALAEKHRIPFVDLRQRNIPGENLALLPRNIIKKYEVLPLVRKDDVLLVAIHSVDIRNRGEAIARAAGCKQVKFVISPPSQIRKIMQMVHAKKG